MSPKQHIPAPGIVPHSEGGAVVPRPGRMLTFGRMLDSAFGADDALPDDMVMLLQTMDRPGQLDDPRGS